MIIVYCDACGLRITESELGQRGSVECGPNSWHCASCAAKASKAAHPRPKVAPAKMFTAIGRESISRSKHSSLPPSSKKSSTNQLALIAVGVTLLMIGILLVVAANRRGRDEPKDLSLKRPQTQDENSASTPVTRSAVTPSVATEQVAATPNYLERKVAPSDPDSSTRVKTAVQDIASYRDERAAKLLEEQKAWFKQNASEPWEYRERLRAFVASYRSTPAGAEADKLLDDLKSMPPPATVTISGRYIRVTSFGPQKFLHLAEVQVFSAGQNVALQGKATQSSTDFDGDAQRAIDGNTNGDFFLNSVSHTKLQDDPWWEVDLGQVKDLQSIMIWNRTDRDTQGRLTNFKVEVLDDARKTAWEKTIAEAPTPNRELTFRTRTTP